MKKAIAVIASYNEAENIESIISEVLSQNDFTDILIVDDNSPDGTADLIERYQAKDSRVHLIKRAGKLGYGTAFIEGFTYAIDKGYDYIFSMDADHSHDPADLNRFLEMMEDADCVIGSRYIDGIRIINWPLRRLFLSVFANRYVRFITGLKYHDCTSGFRCYRADILKKSGYQNLTSNGYSFLVEILYGAFKKNARIKEVPIIFTERASGKSKMSQKVIFEAFFTPIRCRLRR